MAAILSLKRLKVTTILMKSTSWMIMVYHLRISQSYVRLLLQNEGSCTRITPFSYILLNKAKKVDKFNKKWLQSLTGETIMELEKGNLTFPLCRMLTQARISLIFDS